MKTDKKNSAISFCYIYGAVAREIGTSSFLGVDTPNLYCFNCDVAFRGSIPKHRKKYEGYVADKNISFSRSKRLAKLFDNSLNISKESRILDIGAGSGSLLYEMKKIGYNKIRGLEPSPAARKEAEKRLNLSLDAGFFEEVDNLGEQDVIVMVHTLEHFLPPLEPVFEKIKNSLNSGGILILVQLVRSHEIPLITCGSNQIIPCNPMFCNSHFWSFSEKAITLLAEKSGFILEQCISFCSEAVEKQHKAEIRLGKHLRDAMLNYHLLALSGKYLFKAILEWVYAAFLGVWIKKLKHEACQSPQMIYVLKKR